MKMKDTQRRFKAQGQYLHQGGDKKDPIAQLFHFPNKETKKKTEKSNTFLDWI